MAIQAIKDRLALERKAPQVIPVIQVYLVDQVIPVIKGQLVLELKVHLVIPGIQVLQEYQVIPVIKGQLVLELKVLRDIKEPRVYPVIQGFKLQPRV